MKFTQLFKLIFMGLKINTCHKFLLLKWNSDFFFHIIVIMANFMTLTFLQQSLFLLELIKKFILELIKVFELTSSHLKVRCLKSYFHTQCDFDTHEWDLNALECHYDTYECDLYT
jgi:hypothetical protein